MLASETSRSALNANLKSWSDTYDMVTAQKDQPFVDSSNITLPFTAAQLESLLAYVVGLVFQPTFFLVTGLTPTAAQYASVVEKFYNAELRRLRLDGSSYFQRMVQWLHLALRDGTCVLEVLWNRHRQRKRTEIPSPRFNENNEVEWGYDVFESDVFVRDYAEMTPISLKEFGLIPFGAKSIEEAAGVWRNEWLYEVQLDRKVRAGYFDSKEVERALRYWQNGNNAYSSDPQGDYDKTASYQGTTGQGRGGMSSPFFKNRGPLLAKRIHSRDFDMNQDGIPEENIFWIDYIGQRLLGWMPYDYATGQRPFFPLSPFPRPDRFEGYSLVERLAGVQTEIDAQQNNMNDLWSMVLQPLRAVKEGSKLLDKKGTWRLGQMIEVESNSEADPTLRFVGPQPPSVLSYQNEALIKQYGQEYTGLSDPSLGTQGGGRRSATEIRQRQAAGGVRQNLIATWFRVPAMQVINFVHSLNRQYLQQDPQTMVDTPQGPQVFTLPLEVMAQDYIIGVAGATDPVDSTTRRQDTLALVEVLMQFFPELVKPHAYYLAKKLIETYGWQEVQAIIGTPEQAQQMQQMMMQMQAQQAAGGKPGGPGGASGGPPARPAGAPSPGM